MDCLCLKREKREHGSSCTTRDNHEDVEELGSTVSWLVQVGWLIYFSNSVQRAVENDSTEELFIWLLFLVFSEY